MWHVHSTGYQFTFRLDRRALAVSIGSCNDFTDRAIADHTAHFYCTHLVTMRTGVVATATGKLADIQRRDLQLQHFISGRLYPRAAARRPWHGDRHVVSSC